MQRQLKIIMLLSLASSLVFAASETTLSLNISPGTAISLSWLEQAWAQREDLTQQELIANYLLTKPKLPEDYSVAWQTARLVSFIGNYGAGEKIYTKTSTGANLFDYGVTAAKVAIKLEPNRVEGQYWYAVDLGSYGLANGIVSSATNASAGMDALRKAMSIDPSYDYYGSSRILGRYYQELPGLFGGSNKKALQFLTEATTKAPTYRNNWVFLGQYYLKIGAYQRALAACTKAVNLGNIAGNYEEQRYLREAKECMGQSNAQLFQ